MASRCVSTLNDLDKISNRIYHKHSKGRFRANIEAKLKASREKAERSLREIDEGSCYSSKASSCNRSSVGTSSATLSSRYFSTSASTESRPTTSDCQNKVGKEKTRSKPATSKSTESRQRERVQRRKTKFYPSCSVGNQTEQNKDYQTDDTDEKPRTVSVFGKYNGKGSEYKPTAWFNLPQETSVGAIDSLACDTINKKPLCYSVNVKKGEIVPNILRNKLEVRVGQNGIVRMEKKMETVISEVCDGDVRQGKKRTAPLSWEEQLHWHNACVISSEPSTDGNSASENLCETHPVIFHEKKPMEQEKYSKLGKSKNHSNSPAYKVSLESHWVNADRRNLVSTSEKCRITSVEIEDTRSEDGEVVCSEKKHQTQDGANHSEKEHTRVLSTGETIIKKVSFEDNKVVKEKTISDETEKDFGNNETRASVEVAGVAAKTADTEKVPFVLSSVRKVRPKTSYERSRRDDQATKDVRKLRRPHTAPPAPPSSPRNYSDSRLSFNFAPIRIPTSHGEVENDNFLSQNQTNKERQNIMEPSQSSTPEDEKQKDIEKDEEFHAFSVQVSPSSLKKDTIQNDSAPKKRVTFCGNKSAPVSRTISRQEEVNISRAKSSPAIQRSLFKPSPPIVVESESSLELPKDLPPAQALVALRKKIRDDLAQQNHELQLDIQQLYLRKHSE